MNTFKKATKRITAVAASAALVSSAVFGASLASYPGNFENDSEFDGQIVIGADADMAAATSIIEDLTAELAGGADKVKITAKKTSTDGGDIVSALDDKSTLNFGSTISTMAEELDDDSTDLLEDNDLDGEDYTQKLEVGSTLKFDYSLFDDVTGEDEAKAGLYLADDAVFATYTLEFDGAGLDATDLNDSEFNGETITIMGNEFTVLDTDSTEITMVGGANSITVAEGESQTVTLEGVSYDVQVNLVSDDKVSLSINGDSQSVDFDEVETVAGVTVGVTDFGKSDRDSVQGYVTLVIGGQKIEITSTELKVNDEDFEDIEMYEDYTITAAFSATGLTVTYAVDENTLLEEGESVIDPLFGAFTLSFEGTNDVEYSDFLITSTSKGVDFGSAETPFNLYNGNAIPAEFELSTDDVDSTPLFLGSNTDRILFKGSALPATGADLTEADGDAFTGVTVNGTVGTMVEFDLSVSGNDIAGQMFFDIEGSDEEDMKLFQIKSIDEDTVTADDSTLTFDELIGDNDLDDVKIDDVDADLDLTGTSATNTGTIFELDTANLATPVLYLENELEMSFTAVEDLTFDIGDITVIDFDYNADVEADDETYTAAANFEVTIKRAVDVEDALILGITDSAQSQFASSEFSEVKDGSDYEIAVDAYGTMITVETEDYDEITISVPDEEVYATVNFNFGDAGSSVKTFTVDEDAKDAKVAELEADGYSVSTEKISTETVEFDITAPVMASEVEGNEDMIVVGGPAVNAVAVSLLGEGVVGVEEGEAVVRFFADSNSVLVYGWDAAGTKAAANKLNAGGLSGTLVDVE